ncbi:MAG: type II 3-dehydroquinate dehydratase [Gammaproteobacteria bacterium]
MANVLVLNGPNLNLLGTREPSVYGANTLADVETAVTSLAAELGHEATCFQSNAEAELVDRIHSAAGNTDFIIFNPGAFTHTSLALRDAILGVNIPFIEIHISNVHAREEFRKQSYFADIATGTITGLGTKGYELALQAAHDYLHRQTTS